MDDLAQLSLFTVSTVDPPWRDCRDAMAYPFLSLEKGRTEPIEYERKGVRISVAADRRFSIASIWDWDLIIFAASHLNQAIEDGRKPAPRISFVPYDCLKQIRRPTSGPYYARLAEAIRRLRATTIITNVRFEDIVDESDNSVPGEERPFSWLTDYRLPKKYRLPGHRKAADATHITPSDHEGEPDPTRKWEIRLSPWLYQAILRQRDLLAVHPDYFLLTGGVERWLYRLARKAVPEKIEPPEFRFRLETLFEASGLAGRLRRFRNTVERITDESPMPEYSARIERNGQDEWVTLYRDPAKPARAERPRTPPKRIEPDSLLVVTPRPEWRLEDAEPSEEVAAVVNERIRRFREAQRAWEEGGRKGPEPEIPNFSPAEGFEFMYRQIELAETMLRIKPLTDDDRKEIAENARRILAGKRPKLIPYSLAHLFEESDTPPEE